MCICIFRSSLVAQGLQVQCLSSKNSILISGIVSGAHQLCPESGMASVTRSLSRVADRTAQRICDWTTKFQHKYRCRTLNTHIPHTNTHHRGEFLYDFQFDSLLLALIESFCFIYVHSWLPISRRHSRTHLLDSAS